MCGEAMPLPRGTENAISSPSPPSTSRKPWWKVPPQTNVWAPDSALGHRARAVGGSETLRKIPNGPATKARSGSTRAHTPQAPTRLHRVGMGRGRRGPCALCVRGCPVGSDIATIASKELVPPSRFFGGGQMNTAGPAEVTKENFLGITQVKKRASEWPKKDPRNAFHV